MKNVFIRTVALVVLAAPVAFAAPSPSPASAAEKTIGVNLGYRDMAVKPGDDFEEYANGGWRKATEIPPDRSSTGVGYEVFLRAEQRNADLIKEAGAGKGKAGTPERMIADYYAAFMDTAAIEKRGLAPLQPRLAEIAKISSKEELARVLGQRLRADVDPLNATVMWTENLFGLFVTQALSDPARTVPYLLQGGLGMPDREYYVSEKPEMAKLRTAYQEYVHALFELAGIGDADARTERIMTLELNMATAHLDRMTSEDVHKANNPRTAAQLMAEAPGLDWKAYL
ncbi:MAG: M13 family metallopeptidase, partial [Verrucomicrobiota bacterium]|nr:M13 family metallopeptidase [Verrucomicrobiota bacterium]